MHRRPEVIGLSALAVLFLVACEPQAGQDQGAEMEPMDQQEQQQQQAEIQADSPFGEFDANQDQALQREEFVNWTIQENALEGIVTDEGLDREAFQERIVEVWDVDSDGNVSQAEWQSGAQRLFGDGEVGTFQQWDTNGDGSLSADEVRAAAEERGLWERLDADGNATIDRNEVGDFFFQVFDMNGDSELDATEWESGRGTWFEEGPGL
ncbi:MAG TPA: hypothetical protein VFQ22_06855 [Longimicrobiales bacterium]|nr:hypothetical protein [Longimicrobiales bacterium]